MVFIYLFILRKKKSGNLGHWAAFLLQPHWSSWFPFAPPLCIQHSQLNLIQTPDWHSRQPHSRGVGRRTKIASFNPATKICLHCRRPGFNPWVKNICWRRKWQPHCSILAWRIPWTEEPGGPQSMRSHRGQEEARNTSHGTAGLLLGCPLLATYGNKGRNLPTLVKKKGGGAVM